MQLAVNTVTFRSRPYGQVIDLVKKAGFNAVEWAGDVHLPPGNIELAKQMRRECQAAELEVTSYASYYRCDRGAPTSQAPFSFDHGPQATMDTAISLGVSDVRVWAGRYASESSGTEYREEVAECLSDFCQVARDHDMRVHLEFHRNTLADTARSAIELLTRVNLDNLFSYWQPRHGVSAEQNVSDIATLGCRLSNVHVFHWLPSETDPSAMVRRPLAEGLDRWQKYFQAINEIPAKRYAMLEFVKNDDIGQFFEDSKALRKLSQICQPEPHSL